MHVMKKDKEEEEFWPRLLKDKALEKNQVKIDWDRYVDEDEEEEGFDTSAVSFVFYHICHYFVNSSVGYLFCVFVLAVFLIVMDTISPSNISQFSLIDFTHTHSLMVEWTWDQ